MSILCLYFYVTPLQIQFPSLYINQDLLLNSFFKITIFMSSNAAFEVESAWSLHSLPIHLLLSLFPVICLALKLLITQTFFGLPRRFESSGVKLYFLKLLRFPQKNNKKKTLTHNSEANVDANSTMPRMRDPKPKKWNAILSCHGTGSMIANKNVKAESKNKNGSALTPHVAAQVHVTVFMYMYNVCKNTGYDYPLPPPQGKSNPHPSALYNVVLCWVRSNENNDGF